MAYFGKRQLILAALVVALGTAIYLNWQFSSNRDLTDTNVASRTKELGEAQFVNNSLEGSSSDEKSESSDSSTKINYFTKTRQERKESRAKATEVIKEIMKDANMDDKAKEKAIQQAGDIASIIKIETDLEAFIRAKVDCKDCLVFLMGDSCSVVVGSNIDQKDAVLIKDIVINQANVVPEKIKIIESV
ncbi:MAG: SpoIIIAH-like family protein [Oscillospiraceae bacterium]|jgi:stage III sporulation protein AH|nr:SpoIIIAH-like family protein [Oscillospiraceae bacterium]